MLAKGYVTLTEMTATTSIPIFSEINECHEATGFPVRSELPEFHVFGLEETYPCARMVMPPFRRGFYLVTFFEALAGATLQLEDETVEAAPDLLVFSPPEQMMSWACSGEEKGFMLCFKAELLASAGHAIEEMFPFFDAPAVSVLPLLLRERETIRGHFAALRAAAGVAHAYRLTQIAALTTAFLFECRHIHERLGGNKPELLGSSALVSRFRQMVGRCFSEHCTVESYAECLHVSADHLRAMVKKHTGRTAREFMDERMVLEARRLLAHTSLSVGEVAWQLQFAEPTHFARYFKRLTGKTPLEYRKEMTGALASVAVAEL